MTTRKKTFFSFNPSIRSRYNRSFRKTKFNTIKSKMRKNSRRKSKYAVNEMKKYKENITKIKEEVDKMSSEIYKINNISKENLRTSWKKALLNYRKGNYNIASQYLLIYLLVASVLLNRHGTYRNTYKTSTTLLQPDINELMCGLLNYSERDYTFNHKSKAKASTNKILGPINYFKALFKKEKIFNKNNEEKVEDLFDLVYTCRNPYVKKIFTLI